MTSAGYDLLNETVKNDKTQAGKLADFLKSAYSVADMKSCLESDKYDARITADTDLASTLGVSGTPGFYVNDNSFPGAYNYVDMEKVVTSALE